MTRHAITATDHTCPRSHRSGPDDTTIWRMALGPGFAVGPSGALIDYLGCREARC